MEKLLLGITLIIGAIYLPNYLRQIKKGTEKFHRCVATVCGFAAVFCIVSSFIVTLPVNKFAYAYFGEGKTMLRTGHNFVAPWTHIEFLDTTAVELRFNGASEQDEAAYGAYTEDDAYIHVLTSLNAQIDTERIDEYINMFGSVDLSASGFYDIAKNMSRKAIEKAINSKDVLYVMGNMSLVSEEVEQYFLEEMSKLPVTIIDFSLDDIIPPVYVEAMMREQSELHLRKENAKLRQELNVQQAHADAAKAKGEALVQVINEEAEAEAKKIQAEAAIEVAEMLKNKEE